MTYQLDPAKYEIFRHRLFDIDVILNRTLVYGVLTTIVGAVYVLIVGVLGNLLHASQAGLHTLIDLAVSLLAASLVAVAFQPLRERLQRTVNHLMYGDRDEPYAALTRLGIRLEANLEADSVLQTVVETIATALKLPYAAIRLREDDSLAASFGAPPHSTTLRSFPLQYQGEIIGELMLAPRAMGEVLTRSEEHLLTDLARQAEVAVHNVRLTSNLRQSRERIVTAREEERRRLRRDLHDGLGPQLASQMLTIDAISRLVEREPRSAQGLLADLKSQTQAAVKDIRRLIYGLRPPSLDDLGLVAALKEGSANVHGELQVSIETARDLPPLPAAVEVAAYRIVQEAILNAIHHAQASACRVRLDAADSKLFMEIKDNGRGLPENLQAGVGINSMHERAAELGGRVDIASAADGGTCVQVWLPLPKEDR